jgi:IstB-like ATP binding protein
MAAGRRLRDTVPPDIAVNLSLGHKACRDNRSVLYRSPCCSPSSHSPAVTAAMPIQCSPTGVQLLILDDWGLEPLDAGARRDLYEILKEPYGRRSTVLTSQNPRRQMACFYR